MKNHLRILHLEDVPDDAELVARELKKHQIHFDQLVVDSEGEYLNALDTFQPDIILCDHSLPSFNSLKALRIAKTKNIRVPFILITATMSEAFANEVVKEGAADYILKDRLSRIPYAVLNAVEKYKYDQDRKVLNDVVLKRQLESQEMLAQMSAKLLLATKASGVGVWDYEIAGSKISWDEQMFSIYGIAAADFNGSFQSWGNCLHLKDRKKMQREISAAIKNDQPYSSEFRIKKPGGEIRHIACYAIGQKDADGKMVRMVGTSQDITERRRNEEKTFQSEARFRALVENNYGAIVLRNEALIITYLSPYATKLFGYSDQEKSGRKFAGMVHPEEVALFKQHERTVLDNPGMPFTIIFRVRNKAGEFIWVEEVATNLLNDKSVKSVVSNFRDVTERKQYEEQQLLMASIVNSSDDAIISFSIDGKITSWNNGAQKLYHYEPEEVIGKNISILIPPYKMYEETEIINKIKAQEPIDHYETERIRKDGRIVEVSLTVSPILDAMDRIIGVSKIARDITEIKRTEEIIKKSDRQYRQLMEDLPVAIYTCDAEGRILLYNNAATQLWGREPKVLKDKWCGSWKIVKADGTQLAVENCPMAETLKTGKAIRGEEFIVERPDGSCRNILPHPTPMFGPSGLIGAVNMLLDITEIRAYENALRQSETQYRQIVETAQEGIWVVDEEDRTIFVNKKLCEILGYEQEAIMGKEIYFFMDEVGKDIAAAAMQKKKEGYSGQNVFKYISKTGKDIWTNISANPLFNEDGTYKGALAMITDITEKVKLQQQLIDEQVNKQKEITKAVVNAQEKERSEIGEELHDNVNQLLATACLYLDHSLICKDNYPSVVKKGREHVSTAIEEIRKLSKALVGPAADENMGLIASVEELISNIAIVKNITIDFKHSAYYEEGSNAGLRVVIYRIVQEQLNNILKHANASGVEILLEDEKGHVKLIIKDNGQGFDTSGKKGGIGLKNIQNRASIYDGNVTIRSSPAKGCTMKVIFKNYR